MRRIQARIEGLALGQSGNPLMRLSCPRNHLPLPGQGFLACKLGTEQALRRALFPVGYSDDGFLTDIAPDPKWHLGDPLDLLGPLGSGFTPPPHSKRWLLLCMGRPPDRLLPLVEAGLKRGNAISLSSQAIPRHLSAQVELNPALPEALAWADYLAMDLRVEELTMLRAILELPTTAKLSYPAQVLLATELACGMGACHACAVPGKRKWLLACSDGPIFALDQLKW